MKYRWTLNIIKELQMRSISVVASDLVEVITKVNARYQGYTIVFAARMEAIE